MRQKRLVPKRRFEGFEGTWKILELEKILHVNSGRDYKHLNKGNIPVYGTGGLMLFVDDKLSDVDGIGIGRKGTIDKPQYLKAPFWTVDTLFFITPILKTDLYFMYSKSQIIDWRKMDESTGVPSLSKNTIEKIRLYVSTYQEQQKIGQFFKHLDEMIALEQRKIDKTLGLKSAYLAEMFPAEGERVPKRRFEGFMDDWQSLKLIEFVDKAVDNRGKTPPLNINGSHPLIEVASLGNGSPDYYKVEKYLDDSSFQNNLRDYIKKNDILFSTVGRIGLVSLMDEHENAAIAQNIIAFRAKKDYIPEYIYALFSTEQSKLKANRIVMGAVQPSIKVSQLIHNEYYVPNSKKEQKQIGDFFKRLDDSIKNHQDKLEKLKATKQAYLHEMFV